MFKKFLTNALSCVIVNNNNKSKPVILKGLARLSENMERKMSNEQLLLEVLKGKPIRYPQTEEQYWELASFLDFLIDVVDNDDHHQLMGIIDEVSERLCEYDMNNGFDYPG